VSEKIHIRTACEHALRPGARVVSVDDGTPELSANNLVELTALAERGAITPVIDRRYPLAQIVEAHRYVDQGHKRGNVVISILPDGELGP
jgi:NADPH:quinone reductase-like Zn-dependent oxidoreductase